MFLVTHSLSVIHSTPVKSSFWGLDHSSWLILQYQYSWMRCFLDCMRFFTNSPCFALCFIYEHGISKNNNRKIKILNLLYTNAIHRWVTLDYQTRLYFFWQECFLLKFQEKYSEVSVISVKLLKFIFFIKKAFHL